jgi:hypothetical protein
MATAQAASWALLVDSLTTRSIGAHDTRFDDSFIGAIGKGHGAAATVQPADPGSDERRPPRSLRSTTRRST